VNQVRRDAWFTALRTDETLKPMERLAAYAVGTTANSAGERASLSGTALARAMGLKDRQARTYLYGLLAAGWLEQTERGRQNGRRGIASKYALTLPTGGLRVPVGKGSQQATAHAPTGSPGLPPPLPKEAALRDTTSLAVGSAPAAARVLEVLDRRADYDNLQHLAYAAAGVALGAAPQRGEAAVALNILERREDFASHNLLAEGIVAAVIAANEQGQAA
jgi:hypothetical protein